MSLKHEPSSEPLHISATTSRRIPASASTNQGPKMRRFDGGNVKRFPGGIAFKAHRLLHHSTVGWRVTKKKGNLAADGPPENLRDAGGCLLGCRVQGLGFRVGGVGCRVWGVGCGVQGAGFRVQGRGFRV